jgi:hypothetical protein
VIDGQETPVRNPVWPGSIVVGVGVPGEVGLNVTSCLITENGTELEAGPTAVHCVVDGHAMLENPSCASCETCSVPPLSSVTRVGVPGDVGLNVTSRPLETVAVHCVRDGHAMLGRVGEPFPVAIVVAAAPLPGEAGSKVTSSSVFSKPTPPTAVHCVTDGHATPPRRVVPANVPSLDEAPVARALSRNVR